MESSPQIGIWHAVQQYWSCEAARTGRLHATQTLLAALWEFARNSTPTRLRQRYGDIDYDWDHHVNTTSGAVGWRDRLLGALNSPYQPTEPALFHEMLESLARESKVDFRDFIFIDVGSGKGRTLLMASDYPFQRIIGVELLPALHQIAQENLRCYSCLSQQCFALESICVDATKFAVPHTPLVIYLFNPFPESGLRRFIRNLEEDFHANPRSLFVLYHNPLLENVLTESALLRKIAGTHQYSIFASAR
jgi:hypothetical protein